MKFLITLAIFGTALSSFAQRDYYAEGNSLIQSGQFAQAEQLFRDAIAHEPANADYASQLGVCLLQQAKYQEAETVLNNVLAKEPNNATASWYIGVVHFSAKNYAKAIPAFEKVLPLLDRSTAQYPSAFWFIGKSYSAQLKTAGLSSKEADRMFECYDQYLKIMPEAPDATKIAEYVKTAKQNRPVQIKDKWIAQ